MSTMPPVILIFDSSAILASHSADWLAFGKQGECWLPQVVYEEIEFLCDRAADPAWEPIAREFIRFLNSHPWHHTHATAHHGALVAPEGQALSKKARQTLAVAQCALGVALENSHKLVVVIANNQTLLQYLECLITPNLCGITVAALKQWSQTRHRPAVVSHRLEDLKLVLNPAIVPPLTTRNQQKLSQQPNKVPSPRVMLGGPTSANRRPSVKPRSSLSLLQSLMITGLICIMPILLWSVIQPEGFRQVWRSLGLPTASPNPLSK